MRVVALLTVRNEELYLQRCLEHLYSQGIETCFIDNDSTDRTLDIAKNFLNQGIFRIEHLPFNGQTQLFEILKQKEKLSEEIEADWFIGHDADEIREAPFPYKTLLEGIKDVDRQGYNAINFDEFVFLPTSEIESYESKDYVKEMYYYYYFDKRPLHRVNTWKKTKNRINLIDRAGHQVLFKGRKIFPKPFILRHYIFLSKGHAIQKYGINRNYSPKEVIERGWHKDRASFKPEKLVLPSKDRLKKITDNKSWDKSDPWPRHEFFGI